jgi:hypothetical protein
MSAITKIVLRRPSAMINPLWMMQGKAYHLVNGPT